MSLAERPSERLTVGDIVAVLRDRAFAVLVVLLGLPNCLPMPPPIPLVCGLLLALVAVQIIAGRPAPWLPRSLLHRSIPRADVERAVLRAAPVFRRLERFSRSGSFSPCRRSWGKSRSGLRSACSASASSSGTGS